jgi:hypothetical protein
MTADIIDYSVDIESLGTHPGAAILSIGCVQFNRFTGKTGAEFYVEIDHASALKCGEVSASTLQWWVKNNPALLAQLLEKKPEQKSLATALDEFSRWMRNASAGIPVVKGSLGAGTPHVWGNGATMDISLLEHAFANGGYGLALPWSFRHIRDMRTIMDAARHRLGDYDWWPQVPQQGTAHNALDDARYQALAMIEAFRVIKTGVDEPPEEEEEDL